MEDEEGCNWIAGEPSRKGTERFTAVDPRTAKPSGRAFPEATPGEVEKAVGAAAEAFNAARDYQASKLVAFLTAAADELAGQEGLLEVADAETALGIQRLESELARTCGQLRMFADFISEGSHVEAVVDTAEPERKPRPRPDLRRMLFPIGPVVVFGAGNFPLAFGVLGGDTASAWAAGCPVVAKGHPSHPGTSDALARAANRAVERTGFPHGWFSLLQGQSHSLGEMLVSNPAVRAVGFTGSLRAGRKLHDIAARRPEPIPVYAEMGSVNPVFLSPGSVEGDPAWLAGELCASVLTGGGQLCTKPGLVFMIDSGGARELVRKAAEELSRVPCPTLLNETVPSRLDEGVRRAMATGKVELLAGGGRGDSGELCFRPTALLTSASDYLATPELWEERFGPVTMFILCADMAEALSSAASLKGHLAASIYARDGELDALRPLARELAAHVGRVVWNGMPTGVEVCRAMQHGGPYPATTSPWTTSVGAMALKRFMRPVCFQNAPEGGLPDALRSANPLGIMRLVNGRYTREPL